MQSFINFDNLVQNLEVRINHVCHLQARYPILWLVGKPDSGKTWLAKEVCHQTGWKYINFTLDEGYLDSLIGKEQNYMPEDFVVKLRLECQSSMTKVIILDEIEPLLGWWKWDEQEVFFKIMSKITRLNCGVVLVTRLRTSLQLENLVSGKQHVFEIPEGEKL